MLHLRVFGSAYAMAEVAETLSGLSGARHITRTDTGHRQTVIVTADLEPGAADDALHALQHLGVPPDDVSLLRIDAIQPLLRHARGASLVWADLLGQAGEHARPVARYLAFMAAAGIIAGYERMIYDNEILIVGAMAVSPDLLPITSICIGAVLGRGVLVLRAVWTLGAGLACACLFAGGLTAVLDLADLLPSGFVVGEGALSGLTTVNSSTIVVALAAGTAGMLALETRASSAVGVAISVTTIPASAYLGVATGVGEVGKAAGAAAVLGVNVTMLTLGGTATLLAQRGLARRALARRGAAEAAPP